MIVTQREYGTNEILVCIVVRYDPSLIELWSFRENCENDSQSSSIDSVHERNYKRVSFPGNPMRHT